MYKYDKRIVITLDAGGTNFVFGAMQANEFITEPLTLPSNSDNLERCLETMVKGFGEIIKRLETKPVAISFAFPGPADYANGIIGGYLPNFPSFRDGVALGAFLKEKFNIPIFINNDADLFAFGEAIAGRLPEINSKLKALGSEKVFRNLLGYTFGTGFGFGLVSNNALHTGDNSCVETFCLKHKYYPEHIVEDGVSIRALKRVYGEISGDKEHNFEPKDLFDIAEGRLEGDRKAAIKAFEEMGTVAGDAMATAVTLIDGVIVIGGGITSASKYIMPALFKELRSSISAFNGESVKKVQMDIFDLDDETEFERFAKGNRKYLKVFGSDRVVTYDNQKRTGVAISKLGASKAISIGAYSYALSSLDKK